MPPPRPPNISCIGTTWPRISTTTPWGGSPAACKAAAIRPATWPRSSPSMLAVMLTSRVMLWRSYSPGMVPRLTWAMSRSRTWPWLVSLIGSMPICCSEFIWNGGTSTWTW